MWGNPLAGFGHGIQLSSNFPFIGNVIFDGVEYPRDELPAGYLPGLMLVQFTEPVLPLFVLGLAITVHRGFKKRIDPILSLLIAGWFFLPLAAWMLDQPPIYDNFRHFLFILPPVFLFCGVALEWFSERIRPAWVNILLSVALLTPSVYAIVHLHPYSYVYFNAFTGGLPGAENRFELDYWALSYKEATEYVNQAAPQESIVFVWGAKHIVEAYARSDLKITSSNHLDNFEIKNNAYLIILAKHNVEQRFIHQYPLLKAIGRDGAVFSMVQLVPAEQGP
jgi:hypothetical protein